MNKNYVICSLQDIGNLSEDLARQVCAGKVVEISIKKSCSTKTLKQLGYLFGVVAKCIQSKLAEDGDFKSIEEIKELIKGMFFYQESLAFGEIIRTPISLSLASKEEMSKVIDDTLKWCWNHDIFPPPPPNEEII